MTSCFWLTLYIFHLPSNHFPKPPPACIKSLFRSRIFYAILVNIIAIEADKFNTTPD